jgi:DNA helicase-2/ATP-dependent DNA helicase PcrA
MPDFQNDIEGLVYFEAIARTITEAARFSSFGSEIVFSTPALEENSVRSAIWDIFVPLASGAIDIDEDLLETLPRDRLNVLSIHQAKGLEFPFVIVDVGSDFRTNHHTQAFKRFPRNGGGTCSLEDELRPFSPLGVPHRNALDRAFDDLTRHYFVAYSRPQDVLLLVGLNSVRNAIPNIATGWDRSARWHWAAGLRNLVHI